MENPVDSDIIIRETTEAVKREMDFYRELKRRRNIFNLWRPQAELNPQQAQAYQQSRVDPELREVARTVLEEIQYNRNERAMAYKMMYIVMAISIGALILIPSIIYFSVTGSTKHKSKY